MKKRKLLNGLLVLLAVAGAYLLADRTIAKHQLEMQESTVESVYTDISAEISGLEKETSQTVSFVSEYAYEYARGCLNETEQIWYDTIKEQLGTYTEETFLDEAGVAAGLDEEDIDRIFQYVLIDHPELFYVDGYTYTKYTRGDEITAFAFRGAMNVDLAEALAKQAEIESVVEAVLSEIPAEADCYTQVKYIYDYIIASTGYNMEASDNQNIYSVFIGHESVCQGYAKSAQYLFNRLGIPCTLVFGTVKENEGHAWNLVNIEDAWYHLDVTWGDVSYRISGEKVDESVIHPEYNYDYFNITTSDISRTHVISDLLPLPECTAIEANYFYREGLLVDHISEEKLQTIFSRISDGANPDVTIKCTDKECFEEIVEYLITEQKIFDYLKDMGNVVSYTMNDKQLSLTFWMTKQ